jgi:hypothetical protein
MSLFAPLAAQPEALAPLLMPPAAFAILALALFLVLALVSWSYRDVANRHSQKTEGSSPDSHGAHH